MKIKTFKFWVSNIGSFRSLYNRSDIYTDQANENSPVATLDEIDDTINGFISDKEVVNILINDITILRHNNGYSDLIQRTYTVMYK